MQKVADDKECMRKVAGGRGDGMQKVAGSRGDGMRKDAGGRGGLRGEARVRARARA